MSKQVEATSCLIVVPCYNEEDRLDVGAWIRFAESNPGYRFHFVDDGSRDRTAEILAGAGESPKVTVQTLPTNSGKAEAVRQGVLHCLQEHSPTVVGYWDADLATPLSEIQPFVDALAGESLLALGSRWRRLGSRIARRPHRHYLGRVFATAASLALDLPVYDTQCGAKVMDADLARAVFASPFESRWLFDVEILARAKQELGAREVLRRVVEIPLLNWQDVGGSRLTLGVWLRAPLELLRIRRSHTSGRR